MRATLRRVGVTSALFVAMLTAPALIVRANQSTPEAMPGMDMSGPGFPAHIHEGSCGKLGAVAYELNNAVSPGMATPTATTSTAGMPGMATNVPATGMAATSTTVINASLDSLLASPHAINIHLGMMEIQDYIACGNIAGMVMNGALHITLGELNHSGYQGVAILTQTGASTVTVELRLTKMAIASPAAGGTHLESRKPHGSRD